MSVTTQPLGFFIAPFGADGEGVGISFQDATKLSSKWRTICAEYLSRFGESFEAKWEGQLSHITTRFSSTSSSGVAIVTFIVHDSVASSLLLLRGMQPIAAREAMMMFVNSLRRINLAKRLATSTEPFSKIFTIEERPVMIVVPWPDPEISEIDHELVRELELHLAAAFFTD
jgi:hypothetical protein